MIMEEQKYMSCIKINGISILPPLVSEELREEMKYYRQLAIQVENKLKALHDNKNKNRVTENDNVVQSNELPFDSDKESITSNSDFSSTTQTIAEHVEIIGDDMSTQKQINTSEHITEKISSIERYDPVTIAQPKDKSSELVSLNMKKDLNETVPTQLKITKETLECGKPEVPRSLDIVPITLDQPNVTKSGSPVTVESDDIKETPKLVRQGSYILDTPSPMLLAHMQMETSDMNYVPNEDYVPTNTFTNTTRRKEWNITEVKAEWKHQMENNAHTLIDSVKSAVETTKDKEEIEFDGQNENCYKADCKFTTAARSLDCCEAIFIKENTDILSNTITMNDEKCKYDVTNEHNKNLILRTPERKHDIISLNLMNKFGGSLGNLVRNDEFQINERYNTDRYNENSTETTVTMTNQIYESTENLTSDGASETLLIALKEIEEIHKRQMSELVYRQQKEQSLLQKEFERQQLLLLTEIKKSFPKIRPALENKSPRTMALISRTIADSHDSRNNRVDNSICPLDYIQLKNGFHSIKECSVKCHQSPAEKISISKNSDTVIRNRDLQECSSNSNAHSCNLDDKNSESQKLSINRQLFPLDCKTVHVPVIDSSMYTDKHARAATLINAYARGYLVRRLMKTDRVIALKKTYKEALHYMLKLHVDAPLDLAELNFLRRLQLQCDAASMNIVELFAQSPTQRMQIIAHDREIKRSRSERPTSARSYSFATQRTLARKKLKEMYDHQPTLTSPSYSSRSRCQTWTSEMTRSHTFPRTSQTLKRSTSAGAVKKPWR